MGKIKNVLTAIKKAVSESVPPIGKADNVLHMPGGLLTKTGYAGPVPLERSLSVIGSSSTISTERSLVPYVAKQEEGRAARQFARNVPGSSGTSFRTQGGVFTGGPEAPKFRSMEQDAINYMRKKYQKNVMGPFEEVFAGGNRVTRNTVDQFIASTGLEGATATQFREAFRRGGGGVEAAREVLQNHSSDYIGRYGFSDAIGLHKIPEKVVFGALGLGAWALSNANNRGQQTNAQLYGQV